MVAAERSVFVLDLCHQDGAAAGHLERTKLRANVQHVAARSSEETRVAAADPDARSGEQPSRKTAEVPFSATVRTETENHPQTFILRRADESRRIVPARKVELAGPRFVEVPERVGRNCIQAHGLQFLQPVVPVLSRDARVVHLAGADLEWLAVQQKVLIVPGKGVPGACGRGCSFISPGAKQRA